MISRISIVLSVLLKKCNRNISSVPLSFYFGSKCQLVSSSSVGHVYKVNTPENIENIQVSKYLQPFANYSVDELLSVIGAKAISVSESISILKALRMHVLFKGVKPDVFKDDSRFTSLCHVFEQNCDKMEPNVLISGLRSLLEIGVPANAKCITYAEQSIIQNIEKFTTFNLIGCLYFHHKFQETDLQKNTVSLLIKSLCEKTSEISSTSEILMLVHILNIFDEEDKNKLEQKIIKFSSMLNVSEICKIFSAFANNGYRNTFILNTLSFHLRQKFEKPDIKETIDILYSFKKLNFCDVKLVSHLLNDQASVILSSNHPSVICGILSSCGHLRWKQPDLLDACGQWIKKHFDSSRTRELVAYVLTTGALNYETQKSQEILNAILSNLSYKKIESSEIWLDVVWSLAIVNIVDKEILQHVLSADFYKSLIDGSEFPSIINQIKLMNLKAVLKMYHPECIFACDLHLQPIKVPQNADVVGYRKHVISILSNFIPQQKCLCTFQNTESGIYIDAEFIMDKNMRPLFLQDYGMLCKATEVTKPLPPGAKRLALLILFYKDFTLNVESLTGSNALAVRLLSALGYTVVLVPYQEFLRYKTELKKTKYLLMKIKESIGS